MGAFNPEFKKPPGVDPDHWRIAREEAARLAQGAGQVATDQVAEKPGSQDTKPSQKAT